MKILHLKSFLNDHPDNWQELLEKPPYCLIIKHCNRLAELFGDEFAKSHDYVMFNYEMYGSDFNKEICKEARGLILDRLAGWKIISFPFTKFFNYGEQFAANLDWASCWTSEKIDGSLIKIVKPDDANGKLLISSNGNISVKDANIPDYPGCKYKTFADIIDMFHLNSSVFDCGYTYMFELVSPWNNIVINYKEPALYFIGCRNNLTGEELKFYEHPLSKIFMTPALHKLGTAEECIALAKSFKNEKEGIVACDKDFNRLKIKSPIYVAMHHLKNNNAILTTKAIASILQSNEKQEVIAYFPEHKKVIDEASARVSMLASSLQCKASKFLKLEFTTKKEMADAVIKEFSSTELQNGKTIKGSFSGYGFKCLKQHEAIDAKAWILETSHRFDEVIDELMEDYNAVQDKR
jgi:T4 RnlA family RNA ligase